GPHCAAGKENRRLWRDGLARGLYSQSGGYAGTLECTGAESVGYQVYGPYQFLPLNRTSGNGEEYCPFPADSGNQQTKRLNDMKKMEKLRIMQMLIDFGTMALALSCSKDGETVDTEYPVIDGNF